MKLTVWLKGERVTVFMGGDPEKNQAPVVTAELKDPQFLIEPDKHLVIIKETK